MRSIILHLLSIFAASRFGSCSAVLLNPSQVPFIRDLLFGGLPSVQSVECSKLQGIVCSSNGMITKVDLYLKKLKGLIPRSIGSLTALQYFDLSSNEMSGTIPEGIGNCTALQYLDLDTNQLSGSIPPGIGNLTALTTLDFSSNELGGTIPNGMGNLIALQKIDLNTNRLSGHIPDSIGNLTKLIRLDFSSNKLSGPIPDGIVNSTYLKYVDFNTNQLNGSIPKSIGNLIALQYLNFDSNQLSGPIPNSTVKLRALTTLDFSSNSLSGHIPEGIGNCTALQYLDFDSNELNGHIPESMEKLTKLSRLDFSSNMLSGPIPVSIGKFTALQYLDFNTNQLSGPIPENIWNLTKLTRLDFDTNQLSGPIPAIIGKHIKLTRLDFSFNKLSGPIPEGFGNFTALQYLDLSSNELSGPIPQSTAKLTALKSLYLDTNFFIGTRPTTHVVHMSLDPNCWSNVPASNWRKGCLSFCGATSSPLGPCSGHGYCFLNESNTNIPSCACSPGYQQSERGGPGTCVKGGPQASPPSNTPPNGPPSVTPYSTGFIPANVVFKYQNRFSRHVSFGYNSKKQNWNLESSQDWRTSSTAVQSQGSCASCWAISAIAAFNTFSYLFDGRNNGGVAEFSPQQVLDCNPFSSQCNCEGGWPQAALEYISSRKGSLVANVTYPYTGEDGICQKTLVKFFSSIPYHSVSFEQIDFFGWFGVLLALQQQPLIAFLTGSTFSFQNYRPSKTPYSDSTCFSSGIVDHVVVLSGFVLQAFTPYWIVRNSWGPQWGDGGYMYMAITGGDGVCGVHSVPALYPVISRANPCSGPINPCGVGKCIFSPNNKSNVCQCPDPFIPVLNPDGGQTCGIKSPCSTFLTNPCGYGSCVDDTKGGYACVCPQGYGMAYRTDGTQTCYYSGNFNQTTYIVSAAIPSSVIRLTFGLSKSQFSRENPKLDSTLPIGVGTVVNVRPQASMVRCGLWYSWSQGDVCTDVQYRFGLRAGEISKLNPGLPLCASRYIQPGQQICVSANPSLVAKSFCTAYVNVDPTQLSSCGDVQKAYKLDATTLQALNPGLYCGNLKSVSFNTDKLPSVSQDQLCVSAFPGMPGSCKVGKQYMVKHGDNCPSLLYYHFSNKRTLFQSLNSGFQCKDRAIYTGLKLCTPKSKIY